MHFQDTLLQPGQAASTARMNRLHVVTDFNLMGATRNEKNKKLQKLQSKYLTNVRKKYFLTLQRNV